jgi:hypothetical protein
LKPSMGVSAELLALAAVLLLTVVVPSGLPYYLYFLVAQLSATYLIHCPAHYFVGRAVGIRFSSIRLGRTTLAKALPPGLAPFVRRLPILTLSTDKSSLVGLPRGRISAMYASGTVASAGSAVVLAGAVSLSGPLVLVGLSWLVAIGYFLFDVVFSPKSGDLMRARAVRA